MPKVPVRATRCPHCQSLRVVRLPHSSNASVDADYFRCGSCGHVWTVPKPKEGHNQRVA
jgi:predicted Zn finger-like uncharacterized protein